MNADENANPEAAPIAVDLYCPNCEYNLRGLSGDPVRCPECGKASMRKELDYAPRMVERRARRMENSGAVCLLASVATVVSLVFTIATAEFACLFCGLCVLPIIWGISATDFKNACLAEPGWPRVLLTNHAYWAAMASVTAVAWIVATGLVAEAEKLVHGTDRLQARHVLVGAALALVALWRTRLIARLNRPREAAIDRLARAAVRSEVQETRATAAGKHPRS